MSIETSPKNTHGRDLTKAQTNVQLASDGNPKNFVDDAAFAIKICRQFLKALGVWLSTDAGAFTWRAVISKISIIICYYGIGIRSIPTVFYVILEEKNQLEKLRLIVRCIFVVMNAIKYNLLLSQRRKIQKFMEHIELDWLTVECKSSRDIMMEHARFGHLITRICAAITFSSATFLAMLPVVLNILAEKSHSDNATVAVHVRRFAVSSHFGHSVFSRTPIFEFIYWSQVIASYMLHSIAIACYSLAVVLVMHACGQLKILMAKLNELVDGAGGESIYESFDGRMADIVKQHVRVLRFVSSAENMLQGICVVDLGGCTFQICCVGYFSLLEFRAETKNPIGMIAYTTLLMTFLFNIFSFCYIGELLTQQFTKVGEITYMIDWHRLPGKRSLDLGLIITMAQCPITLTAGGVIQLSYICFASVVRTSMGYLNMLRTVMD